MGFRTVLTAAVVIGAVIETSQSGARIVIDGPSDTLSVYGSDGTLGAYIGPDASIGGGTSPVIASFEVGGSEFSALWNGSALVGLGNPTTDSTALANAGGIKEIGDGGILLENTITAAIPVEATNWLQGGTLTSGNPGTAGLPRFYMTAGVSSGQGPGPADVIVSSAVIRAIPGDPMTPETWHVPALVSGWTIAGFSGDQTFQYRLGEYDNLRLDGEITTPAVAAGTSTSILSAPLPAAYRPKKGRRFPIYASTGAAGTYATGIIHSDGNLFVQNPTALAAGNIVSFAVSIPLGNVS